MSSKGALGFCIKSSGVVPVHSPASHSYNILCRTSRRSDQVSYRQAVYYSTAKRIFLRLRSGKSNRRAKISVLLASDNGSGDSNENESAFGEADKGSADSSTTRGRKVSVSRMGGRRGKGKHPDLQGIKSGESENNDVWSFARLGVSLALAFLILRSLLGGLFGNTVYYSTSVYQSVTYSSDGKVETTTKESFSSNIPGLVERSRSDGKGSVEIESNQMIDEEVLDLIEEVDSLLFQKW